MYHSFALIACHFARTTQTTQIQQKYVDYAGWAFVFGIFLFSGSLYALVLSDVKKLGAITPIGGLSFIAGWSLLYLSTWK
jgi:uncharacterized membrane protein YgdD (TMEM256/DUF423 family)